MWACLKQKERDLSSSSLYLDQSADTAVQQLKQEDEIDEPKEIKPPLAAMPFSKLFAYADNLD